MKPPSLCSRRFTDALRNCQVRGAFSAAGAIATDAYMRFEPVEKRRRAMIDLYDRRAADRGRLVGREHKLSHPVEARRRPADASRAPAMCAAAESA